MADGKMSDELHGLADRLNRIPAHDADQHDALVGAAMAARTLAGRSTAHPACDGADMAAACPWCATPFEPATRGGRTKRFCSDRCRNAFNSAKRRFIDALMADGAKVIRDWNASVASCTSPGAPTRPTGVGG